MPQYLTRSHVFNQEQNVWTPRESPSFSTPDDALFCKLDNLLRDTSDRSVLSKQIDTIQKIPGIARYVSPLRCNLLRPFAPFLSSGIRVLEIGSECGAITRFLGECGAETYAVEANPQRAIIAALRCHDLTNVNVLYDRVIDLPMTLGKFDLITLVGTQISVALLLKIKLFLREGGVLLIALENRCGVRHFAGGTQTSPCWTALTKSRRPESQAISSRKEILHSLKQAGYACVEQFIPLADHTFPSTVILPRGLEAIQQRERLIDMFDTPQGPDVPPAIFNMQAVWHSLATAGLIPDMADSLCFLVSQDGTMRPDLYDHSTLAIHFGNLPNGEKKFGKDVILQQCGNSILVKRRPWCPLHQQHNAPIQQILADEPFYNGTNLMQHIRQSMLEPKWVVADVAESFRPWFVFLHKHLNANGTQLPGNFLDCGPVNIIIKDSGEAVAFDLEWQTGKPVSYRYIVFRGIFVALQKLGTVAMPADMHNLYLGNLIKNIAQHFNVDFSDNELENIFDTQNILDDFLYPAHKPWNKVKNNMLTVTFGGLQDIYAFVNQDN